MANFCSRCGNKMQEDAIFCAKCGEKSVDDSKDTKDGIKHLNNKGEENPEKIDIKDGISWTYQSNLYKETTFIVILIKVLAISVGAVLLFMLILGAIDGDLDGAYLLTMVEIFGGIYAGMIVLAAISYYLIYAPLNNGKYTILFEMDNNHITHMQALESSEKAKKIGTLAIFAGLLTMNPTVMSTGVLSSIRNSMTTRFSAVTSILVYRKKCRITLVSHRVERNEVFCSRNDFEWVLSHIQSRCKKDIKVKIKN